MAYHPNMGITRELYGEQHFRPEFVGEKGDRIPLTAVIISMAGASSEWGYVFFFTLQDKDKNLFFYKGSKDLGRIGQVVKINATIKRHNIHQGKRMNVISRPKKQKVKL